MPHSLGVGEVAAQLGVSPVAVSTLVYRNAAIRKRCQLIGGRRQIPSELVPAIAAALNRRSASRGQGK